MLLAQKAYAEGSLALVLYSTRLLDDEQTSVDEHARKSAADLLALLTPVTKSWPSEMAQSSLDLTIQIHGGAGYTRDFLVEQLYRDNRLNPIHEGTTGIRAIDLVGRKIRRGRRDLGIPVWIKGQPAQGPLSGGMFPALKVGAFIRNW